MISPADAWAEGYETPADYLEAFRRINPGVSFPCYVWVVRFAVEPR